MRWLHLVGVGVGSRKYPVGLLHFHVFYMRLRQIVNAAWQFVAQQAGIVCLLLFGGRSIAEEARAGGYCARSWTDVSLAVKVRTKSFLKRVTEKAGDEL